jgi:hypothetical protein
MPDELHVIQRIVNRHWVAGKLFAANNYWAFAKFRAGFDLWGSGSTEKDIGINGMNVKCGKIRCRQFAGSDGSVGTVVNFATVCGATKTFG